MKPLVFCLLLIQVFADFSRSANISVRFSQTASVLEPDTHFNDTESVIVAALTSDAQVTATMSGRDYLQDPEAYFDPDEPQQWGVVDNRLPGSDERPGWLVRQGWESTTIGVPTNQHPDGTIPAAYLRVVLNKPDEMIFTDIDVKIDNPVSTEFVNLWASTSADNFQTFRLGTVFRGANEEFATINFPGLNYQGTAPLEMRIYGVLGEDDGTFGLGLDITIPEPSSAWMACGSAVLLLRRRRKN